MTDSEFEVLRENTANLLKMIENEQENRKKLKELEIKGERTDIEVKQLSGKISHLAGVVGQEASHWTVRQWFQLHGHSGDEEALRAEGLALHRICKTYGIAKNPNRLPGSNHMSRQWPIEAIRIWWPDCCRIHRWEITWKV